MHWTHDKNDLCPLIALPRPAYMQCATRLSLVGAAPVRKNSLREIAMFVTMIAAKIRAFLRYRETVRELSRLTNRELDDLGLTRSEIPFIARSHAAA